MAAIVASAKTARSPVEADVEVERRRRRGVDRLAHPLDDVCRRLRREHAERRDLGIASGDPADGPLRGEQRAAVVAVAVVRQILPESAETFRDPDRVSAGVSHPGGHDQHVGRVLVEQRVGAEAQLAGVGGPHDVVDTDGRRRRQPNVAGFEALVRARKDFLVPRKGITQAHQENRPAGHARGIDVAIEGHGDPRNQVEPIEPVQDGEVLALRHLDRAVLRHREIHPPGGVLRVIRDREAIRRERAALGRPEVEEGMNAAGRAGGDRAERRSGCTASRNQKQSAKDTHV